jgi:tetratricopeptide (TPR) repeat protein
MTARNGIRLSVLTLSITALVIMLAGCAASNAHRRGTDFLEKDRFEEAVQWLETARQEEPENAEVCRDLGIAYYRKPDFQNARRFLLESFVLDSTDVRTLFYLGTLYETLKDYPHAIDIYRRYTETNRGGRLAGLLEARLTRLLRIRMQDEAKAALAAESSIGAASPADSGIAVLYFRNLGKRRDLDPVRKGLADMMITDLSKVKALRVVERIRMQKMLEEMGLGASGMVADASAPRVGRLLGAYRLIQGSFLDLAKEMVRLDAGCVTVENDRAAASSRVQGKWKAFFNLEKDLVFSVLDRLSIQPTREERDAIAPVATENFLAFLAYCRGLDFEDRGMYQDAGKEFRKAAELDPGYGRASEGVDRADRLSVSMTPVADLERSFRTPGDETAPEAETRAAGSGTEEETAEETESAHPATQTAAGGTGSGNGPGPSASSLPPAAPWVNRMFDTADLLDRGFLPGVDQRKPTQEQEQPAFGNSASFELSIPLPPE